VLGIRLEGTIQHAHDCPDAAFTAIWATLAPLTFTTVTTSATNDSSGSCSVLHGSGVR